MSGYKPRVVVYSTETCPYCAAARMLLTRKGVDFEEIPVANDPEKRAEMERLSGGRTVPQILINDEPIGGFDEILELDKVGRLDEILARAAENP